VTGQRPGRPSAPLYINLGSQLSDSPQRPQQQQQPRLPQPRTGSRLQPPQQQQQQVDDEPWLQPTATGPQRTPATVAAGLEGARAPPGSVAPGAAAGVEQGGGSGQLAPWHAPLTAEESELDLVDLVARRVFGHRGFRPRQRDIIDAAIAQQDIFVLMPTGGGKSLCYQVRAPTDRERNECEVFCLAAGSTAVLSFVSACSKMVRHCQLPGAHCSTCTGTWHVGSSSINHPGLCLAFALQDPTTRL
jgi:hypothetical protein